MNTNGKITDLLQFSKRLKYSQFIVYSDEGNLDKVANVYNLDQDRKYSSKPQGLWFSLGRAWINWLNEPQPEYVEEESWRNKRMSCITHVYRIWLNYTVLQILDKKQFDDFEKQYANKYCEGINWYTVAMRYNGILIRYQKSDSIWYDGWDVSSGCIWNKRGIVKTKLLKAWKPTWRVSCSI